MNAALKMQSIYPLAHQVHDDLVYIVPEQRAEEFATLLQHEMSKSRSWYSDLPLAAETGIGPSYGEAK
jgi:DNA polymerase I-like protein with 3'-5' exonuclease and polymerase domains